jgi:hypothetical protein
VKFIYTGKCAQGFVKFTRGLETVEMPSGEAVEVPEWLEAKLKTNSHFEAVLEHEFVVDMESGDPDTELPQVEVTSVEVSTETPRRRGRPPKNRDDAN